MTTDNSLWNVALPDRTRRKKAPQKKSGTRLAVNRAIARKLRKHDCDPVELLARIATDEEAPLPLRFRAVNRLAKLAYAREPEEEPPAAPARPTVDIGAAIAAKWEKAREEIAAAKAMAKSETEGAVEPTNFSQKDE